MPQQREVVEVSFPLPQGAETHPVIVISNNDINENEGLFIGVMMTSEEGYRDLEYTYLLDDSMFTKPLNKTFSAVRMHLIANFKPSEITRNSHSGNSMKIEPFKRLMTHIKSTTFLID